MTKESGPKADLRCGDCREVMRSMDADSIDSIVTDPPYGLSFMGKGWDRGVPGEEFWREAIRVAKPGAHLLAFGGTRTFHRLACAIEDAGWEIRDCVMWVYGSGFPKSLDVGKAIDKMDASEEQERRRLRFTAWVRSTGVTSRQIDDATGTNMGGHYTTAASQPAIMTREHLDACRHLFGDVPEWVEREADIRSVESKNFAEREVVGKSSNQVGVGWVQSGDAGYKPDFNITAPATEAAKQWHGWGTALKPAWEPVIVARKPLAGTVAENVLRYGTGAINVDGCRVGTDARWNPSAGNKDLENRHTVTPISRHGESGGRYCHGRWPANLIHDGSEEVVGGFPEPKWIPGDEDEPGYWHAPAARFFYCAKASKADRNSGLDSYEIVSVQCSSWENEDQKARLRVDTAAFPPRVTGVSGAPCNDVTAWNMLLFGSDSTVPFLRVGRYTIETATNSTTESRTLSWLLRSTTSECTADANSETESGGSHAADAERLTPRLTITSEWTVSARGVERAPSPTRFVISGNAGHPCDHPTVKPTALMRYLCRLVTPPGGTVLDPFMGSGSTGKAAALEGFHFVGIDITEEYCGIARARIENALRATSEELFIGGGK